MTLGPSNVGFKLTTDDWWIIHTKAGGIISAAAESFDESGLAVKVPGKNTPFIIGWDLIDRVVKGD